MYYKYSVLICQIIFVVAKNPDDVIQQHDGPYPSQDVKIGLLISSKHKLYLNLKPVDSVLANEHLPVWIMQHDSANQENVESPRGNLILQRKVMKKLGKITFYQDPAMNSAAVYFHHRRQFDGMIDTRYLIQGLSIDKIHAGGKTLIRLGESGIISRPESIDHTPYEILMSDQDDAESNQYEITQTYRNHVYNAYPEILVIVSCELAQALIKNTPRSNEYTTIVSYVLTLFNGVDMLYSKLRKTNIKLNMAGIIIATKCESVTFLEDCYAQPFSDSIHVTMLNEECAIAKLRNYVFSHESVLPLDSYDLVMFLTKHDPFGMKDGIAYRLEGSSLYIPVYKSKKLNTSPILIAVSREDGLFRNYATVAHELAHLMNVHHDNEIPVGGGQCCGHIMKVSGSYWCKGCSSWSEQSENSFKTFFSSADCCGFINYPRSLYGKGRRKVLTANQQCRCYGYQSSIISTWMNDKYCSSALQCQDDDGKSHQTVLPLDGTRCDMERVCWRRACRSIHKFAHCDRKIMGEMQSVISSMTDL